ncbi:MAG TPA: hypothetical protein PLO43_03665, partial [Chlamydiales bacterium]|nr:hypothetical protein [Chlamydiales bacterium]
MQIPGIMYNANVVLPQSAAYKLRTVLEISAPLPGIGRVASFTGGYRQLQDARQRLNQADQLGDRVMIALEMGSTVGLTGLAVLNPRAGAI